jgi:hypothetical protein
MVVGYTVVTLMDGQMVIGLYQDQAWFGFREGGAGVTGDISGSPVNGGPGTDIDLFYNVKAPQSGALIL